MENEDLQVNPEERTLATNQQMPPKRSSTRRIASSFFRTFGVCVIVYGIFWGMEQTAQFGQVYPETLVGNILGSTAVTMGIPLAIAMLVGMIVQRLTWSLFVFEFGVYLLFALQILGFTSTIIRFGA